MLIGVDWGTTRLRAALIDNGTVVRRASSGDGMMHVSDFPAALALATGELNAPPGTPVLMSGMVGSRQGWREAPYLAPPASLAAVAAALTEVAAGVYIVPGVAMGRDGPWADVMRGEETEIFGAGAEGTVVLPGTHSKWANVEGGAIIGFRTFMTGDVFAALSQRTILARSLGTDRGGAAMLAGVDAARALGAPGELLSRLFSIRAEGLFGRMPEGDGAAFLSGLLVGAEVAAAAVGGPVTLVGDTPLAERYRAVLTHMGHTVCEAAADCAARGQAAIATAAGLIPAP